MEATLVLAFHGCKKAIAGAAAFHATSVGGRGKGQKLG
jgi:hypothetical protein